MANTLFTSVYNRFLNKITDDMYMELTPQDTIRDLQNLLIDAIPGFEFPRKRLDYSISNTPNSLVTGSTNNQIELEGIEDWSYFHCELDNEEINILAILMMNGWLQRQITSIENIRMKYSGTDFKMTSQANHLGKLLSLQSETQRQSHHMQRLYKRRKTDENGYIRSNWSVFREDTVINGMNASTTKSDAEEWPTRQESFVYEGGRVTPEGIEDDATVAQVIVYDAGEIL